MPEDMAGLACMLGALDAGDSVPQYLLKAPQREGHGSTPWAASLRLRALGQTLRALGQNQLLDCFPSEATHRGQITPAPCSLHTALCEEKKVIHVIFLHWVTLQ